MRFTTVVFFQNPDDEADFKSRGLLHPDQRIIRIPGSGVNLKHFGRNDLPRGPLKFLMIARLLVAKGVREFLQAAHEVRQSYPEVEFHLVGPFDPHPGAVSRAEIESAVSSGGVIYHGAVDDVRPFLRDCHVYVLPSYREGRPRSVLEAMAVGRPIITTDAPGCRETVIAGENGWLIPPREVASLVTAMVNMIKMDSRELGRMAAASRRLAETEYDVAVVNRTIESALQCI
jgi:glycosyltransferase involved in cell wall biosynthesis